MPHSRCFVSICCLSLLGAAFAAPKEAKTPKPSVPAAGVKTPGVLIPFASLKSEAEVTLDSPPAGMLFTDSIVLADASGVHRLNDKTNQPFEPSRDIKGVEKPCGGLVSAFSFVWTPSCAANALAKIEMRPVRPPGQGGNRGPGGRGGPAPDAPKPEGGEDMAKPQDGETPKAAKAEAPKPEPPPPAAPRTPPAPPAPPAFVGVGIAPIAVTAVAASADSIWLLADEKTALQRIDPKENKIVAEVRLPAGCTSILSAERSLWVTCPSEAKILRIDPLTNLVDKRIEVPAEPVSVAAGEASIWVLCRKEGKVARIDPKTNKVTATIELSIPNADGMLAFGEGNLWASVPGFPVMRIAPGTDKVVQQFHGNGGGMIQFGLGSVWVASAKSNKVIRFDPKRITATLAE